MKKIILIFIVVLFSATFVWADETIRLEKTQSSKTCDGKRCKVVSKSLVVEEKAFPVEPMRPVSQHVQISRQTDAGKYWEWAISCYEFGDLAYQEKFGYSYDCGTGIFWGEGFEINGDKGFEYVLGALIFQNKSGKDKNSEEVFGSAYGLKAGVNYAYVTKHMDLFVQVSRVMTIVSITTDTNFPDLNLFDNQVFQDTCLQFGGRIVSHKSKQNSHSTRFSFGPMFCDKSSSGFSVGIGQSW